MNSTTPTKKRARIKGELVSEPFWAHIRDQFTEGEQHYFVAQYCEHVVQMEKLASVEYTEKNAVGPPYSE